MLQDEGHAEARHQLEGADGGGVVGLEAGEEGQGEEEDWFRPPSRLERGDEVEEDDDEDWFQPPSPPEGEWEEDEQMTTLVGFHLHLQWYRRESRRRKRAGCGRPPQSPAAVSREKTTERIALAGLTPIPYIIVLGLHLRQRKVERRVTPPRSLYLVG